jgi:hypothetical protein
MIGRVDDMEPDDEVEIELRDLSVIPNRVEATGLWSVTITHLPTGARATAEHENQVVAKITAMERLRKELLR